MEIVVTRMEVLKSVCIANRQVLSKTLIRHKTRLCLCLASIKLRDDRKASVCSHHLHSNCLVPHQHNQLTSLARKCLATTIKMVTTNYESFTIEEALVGKLLSHRSRCNTNFQTECKAAVFLKTKTKITTMVGSP